MKFGYGRLVMHYFYKLLDMIFHKSCHWGLWNFRNLNLGTETRVPLFFIFLNYLSVEFLFDNRITFPGLIYQIIGVNNDL